jgi:hypothetical protein
MSAFGGRADIVGRRTYALSRTYAGNTDVRIDIITDGLTASP